MLENCSRCNYKVERTELANHLCKRCQDILEFGYQSFPAYRLEEKEQTSAKLNFTEQILVLS
jgi:hypothetical protein